MQMEQALQEWLNAQTRGLLQEQAAGIELDDDCLLALASTIYYNVQWFDNFNEANNYHGMFHAPGEDREATYMCHIAYTDTYYWSEGFGAMKLQLFDGSKMWLILPDEGSTPAEVLAKGEALDLVLGDAADWENQKDVLAKLSVPKFDITCKTDLIPVMKELGVTDLFDWSTADLSALIRSSDAYVSQAEHAVRVTIDENGVTAAAFTSIAADNAGMEPIDDEIEFTLDRPFLFIIESRDSLPLFAGVVNEP